MTTDFQWHGMHFFHRLAKSTAVYVFVAFFWSLANYVLFTQYLWFTCRLCCYSWFFIHPHQTSLPSRAPYWNAQKRIGKPHISRIFFRSWNFFQNGDRVKSFFSHYFKPRHILHRTDFHFDHFHSGFVKHLAADSSQFLGQTSQENCKSFSIIVSACALFGCALNTEAKTMFFLMKSMAIGIWNLLTTFHGHECLGDIGCCCALLLHA